WTSPFAALPSQPAGATADPPAVVRPGARRHAALAGSWAPEAANGPIRAARVQRLVRNPCRTRTLSASAVHLSADCCRPGRCSRARPPTGPCVRPEAGWTTPAEGRRSTRLSTLQVGLRRTAAEQADHLGVGPEVGQRRVRLLGGQRT